MFNFLLTHPVTGDAVVIPMTAEVAVMTAAIQHANGRTYGLDYLIGPAKEFVTLLSDVKADLFCELSTDEALEVIG